MTDVFIIGGNGFVGSAFGRLLSGLGITHQVITRDNRAAFTGQSCRILINANGNSKKWLADKDPIAEFDATVRTVADSLHATKCDLYVLLSSCDVYNDFAHPEQNHEQIDIDTARQSRYGFHKFLAEVLVRREMKNHLIFRCGGFVGPGLKKNPIYDILHGGPLWLDPESQLQYIHTDAAARIAWRLIESDCIGETFNLCGDGLVRLREVVERIGCDVPVQPGSPQVTYNINIDKLKSRCAVPTSRDTVFSFVDEALAGAAASLDRPSSLR